MLTAKNQLDDGKESFCENGTRVKLVFDETSPKSFRIFLTQVIIVFLRFFLFK